MVTKGLVKFLCIGAVALMVGVAPQAIAEDPIPTSLGTSLAQNFVGEWVMSMDMGGRSMSFTLVLKDVDGKLGGTLDAEMQPEPRAIDEMEMTDEGNLIMKYEMSFGSQSFKITIDAAIVEEGLAGTFVEASGLFEAKFTAAPKVADPEAEGQRRRSRGRRGAANMTRMRLDGGENLRIAFTPLKVDSEDHARLDDLADGEVFEYVGGRATKIFTEVDMIFPDGTVETENAAPRYPGVYSVWLKKTGDGWNLVFNEEADIWGTMHNAEADATEIALVAGKLDEPAATFKVELKKTDAGGQVRIMWGDTVWSADFEVGDSMETSSS